MVSLPFWKKKTDEPISQVLKQIQAKINTHEIRASSLRQRLRSITGQITLYSVLIYLSYVVIFILGRYYELQGQSFGSWSAKLGVMVLFPVLYIPFELSDRRVYGVRRSVRWWYTRRIDGETREKDVLQKKLDGKIEELKDKNDYYNTQQLLERYDPKSSSPKHANDEFVPLKGPLHKPSVENLRPKLSTDNLRQRGASIPPLPPQVTPSSFAPQPQNIPSFHPSAFSPPPSPSLAPQQHSMTFLDRVLDLLVGEDENAADHRYALICRHCRSHNGLAPPGERGDDVGYLCGRCGGWNGPDPNKAKETPHVKEKPQIKETEVMDKPAPLVETIAELATPKGDTKVEAMIAKTQVAEE